jgi:hypothetical protein
MTTITINGPGFRAALAALSQAKLKPFAAVFPEKWELQFETNAELEIFEIYYALQLLDQNQIPPPSM